MRSSIAAQTQSAECFCAFICVWLTMNPPQGQFPHSAAPHEKNVSADQSAEMLERRSKTAPHLQAPEEPLPIFIHTYADIYVK